MVEEKDWGNVYVVPVSKGKVACVKEWQLRATNDPAVLRKWWGEGAEWNMGIHLGMSGLVAVDCEGLIKHGVDGVAGWETLKRELGFTDDGAWQQTTPSGGLHVVFSNEGGAVRPATDADLGGLGYEVRTGNQLILGPGSYAIGNGDNGHYSGTYKPLNQWVGCPAPMPTVLRDYLLRITGGGKLPQLATPVGVAILEGSRNQALASLAGTMRRRGMSQESIEAALLTENSLKCSPPLNDDEVKGIATSIGRYEPAKTVVEDSPIPEEPEWLEDLVSGDTNTGYTPAMGEHPKPQAFTTPAQVRAVYGSVKWSWPGHIPIGHVTLMVGPQGTGKSYLAACLMATFTEAVSTWPDGAPFTGTHGPVLLCDTEEMRGVYGERLALWEVPDTGWLMPGTDPTYTPKLPKDLAMIEALAREQHCSAILIDSLSGGHVMDENSAAMRQILQRLTVLAGTLQIPVLVIHHVNKRNPLQPARLTLDRIRGSSTISQFCRSVIGLYRLEEDNLLAPVRVEMLKCSFCKPPTPFGFTIADDGLSFHEAPEEAKPVTRVDRAAEFLVAQLQHKQETYNVLEQRAKELGISKNALYEAKERLRIVTFRGFWGLPAKEEHVPL